MADELSLSEEFPRGDEDRWRALVHKALEGGTFDSLTTQTDHGVRVKPLYREPDWPSRGNAAGVPGAAPFIRGGQTARDAFLPWDIRQTVVHPDPLVAQAQIMEALEGGVSSVELRIDPKGGTGIVTRSAADLSLILRDIRFGLATVAVEAAGTCSTHGLELAALLATAIGDNIEAKIAFNVDPLGALARTGALPGAIGDELRQAAAFARGAAAQFSLATTLRSDARCVHEAGGTEVQELGFLIASGAEYVRALILAGMSADAACSQILFSVSVGTDFQVEMSKLRAARRMWGRVAQALGANGPAAAMTLQAVTSRRMLTRRDPWVNLLRNTAACFAAGVGGADIVSVRTFTDALGLPGKLARRLARNTQIIAQEECSLGRVMDAPGGSWAIETLGNDLAEAGWVEFQQIEREGGLAQALVLGRFQQDVGEAQDKRMRAVAHRKEWITGVSDFPMLAELDPGLEAANVESLLHSTPDHGGRPPSDRSWAELLQAAGSGATLADLARSPEVGTKAELLCPIRMSEPYERLKELADAQTSAGRPARMFLAALGPLAEHAARLLYAQNFFAAGGIDAVPASGTADKLAASFKASNCVLACICGSDRRYGYEATGVAAVLKSAGAGRIYLAGKPGEAEVALREAGVAEFIHVGVDVVASLERAHAEMGLGQ